MIYNGFKEVIEHGKIKSNTCRFYDCGRSREDFLKRFNRLNDEILELQKNGVPPKVKHGFSLHLSI